VPRKKVRGPEPELALASSRPDTHTFTIPDLKQEAA
jgi:hypothetical protein